MKCLKVDEYIKRTASVKETELLLQELQVSIITESGTPRINSLQLSPVTCAVLEGCIYNTNT